jgi:general secretion pathway protein F
MARFLYRALSSSGEILSGHIEGASAAAIIEHLQDLGHLPIETVAVEERRWYQPDLSRLANRRLSAADLVQATQQLARLLRASLPLDRSLEILIDLAPPGRPRLVFGRVLEGIRDGHPLAEALASQGEAFSRSYISMVRAGEFGSSLPEVLGRLADFLARSHRITQKVQSALIYPAILLVMSALSIVLVLAFVLPQLKPLFLEAGAALPTPTRIVMAASDFVEAGWWLILIGLLVAGLVYRRVSQLPAFRQWRDQWLMRLPLLRDLIGRYEIGRFARTLGTLIQNGVPLAAGFGIAGDGFSNRVFTMAAEQAGERIKEGDGLSVPLAETGLFPQLAIQLIRVGEETGQLPEMLGELADIYDEEVQRILDRLLTLLVPAVTIGMGFIIAGIIASVMLALISVNDLAS